MLHATRGRVCRGAGKASQINAPLPPTACFDHLLSGMTRDLWLLMPLKRCEFGLEAAEIWRTIE
jgi:hypothetical protein